MTIAHTEPATSIRRFSRARMLLAAFITVAGLGVLISACGGNGGLGGCSVGGRTCDFGCVENVGCAECGGDSDCPLASPRCVAGRCEACSATSDCGVGMACYPRDHECKPVCVTDATCPPDSPICDTTTGACVGCRDEKDCPATSPICSEVDQQCAQCGSNADCGAAAPACDVRDGTCHECVIDTDCPNGDLCGGDHHCHPGCTADSQCDPDHPLCDTSTGACVGCIGDGDCHAPTATCRGDGRCVECLNSNTCAASTPICSHDGLCVQCEGGADCPAGDKCKDNVCVPN